MSTTGESLDSTATHVDTDVTRTLTEGNVEKPDAEQEHAIEDPKSHWQNMTAAQ
jgi:hypothetical protein